MFTSNKAYNDGSSRKVHPFCLFWRGFLVQHVAAQLKGRLKLSDNIWLNLTCESVKKIHPQSPVGQSEFTYLFTFISFPVSFTLKCKFRTDLI